MGEEGGGGMGVAAVHAALRGVVTSLPLRTGLHPLEHLHDCLRLTLLTRLQEHHVTIT